MSLFPGQDMYGQYQNQKDPNAPYQLPYMNTGFNGGQPPMTFSSYQSQNPYQSEVTSNTQAPNNSSANNQQDAGIGLGSTGSPFGGGGSSLKNVGFDQLGRDSVRLNGNEFTTGQSLFGGSYGRSSSDVWGTQAGHLNNAYNMGANLAERSPYESVAGFNPYQTQGQGMALNYANNFNPSNVNNALNFGLNAANVNNNPYLDNAMQSAINPMVRNFQQSIIPNIGRQARGAGRYGSGKHDVAEGMAAQGLMQNIGDVTSRMGSNAYGQGLNTMTQSIGQAPQVSQYNLTPSNIYQGIGGQYQDLSQRYMDAPWNNLQRYSQVVGDPTVLNQSKQGSVRGVTQGFNDVFGGGASMMSDRRLKKDIKRIGTMTNGLPLYLFTYKDIKELGKQAGQKAIGVMSDEVKKLFPYAVKDNQGYDMVDYGALS